MVKPGAVVLEEILGLLSGSRSLRVDELSRATGVRVGDVSRALDALSKAGLVQLDGDEVVIEPILREILLTE